MRYARSNRRHYRVGQQQAMQNSLSGIYISKKDKPKLAAAAGFVGVLIFMLGLLVGVLVDKD